MLTVVRHALAETLVEAAVLALVAVLLVDPASELTLLVLQLQADRSPEETLGEQEQCQVQPPPLYLEETAEDPWR